MTVNSFQKRIKFASSSLKLLPKIKFSQEANGINTQNRCGVRKFTERRGDMSAALSTQIVIC